MFLNRSEFDCVIRNEWNLHNKMTEYTESIRYSKVLF